MDYEKENAHAKDHVKYPDWVIWGSETHAIHFFDSWAEVMNSAHVTASRENKP